MVQAAYNIRASYVILCILREPIKNLLDLLIHNIRFEFPKFSIHPSIAFLHLLIQLSQPVQRPGED